MGEYLHDDPILCLSISGFFLSLFLVCVMKMKSA